jgi:hypothetical protein
MTETTDARKRRLEGERVAGDAVAEVLASVTRWAVPPGYANGRDWRPSDVGLAAIPMLREDDVLAALAPLLDQARAEGAAEGYERGLVEGVEKGLADPGSAWMRGVAERDRLRAAVEALADDLTGVAARVARSAYDGNLDEFESGWRTRLANDLTRIRNQARAVLADADNEAVDRG